MHHYCYIKNRQGEKDINQRFPVTNINSTGNLWTPFSKQLGVLVKMKVLAVLVLATLCFVSSVNAADNEWLPYFIMMSGSGSAPITHLSPAILLTIGLGAAMLTQLHGTAGKSQPQH